MGGWAGLMDMMSIIGVVNSVALLVFALAISAYVTPIVIGGYEILTLPMLIFQQVSSSFNLGFAGALGVVLLIVALVLVWAYGRAMRRVAEGAV